MPKLCPEHKKSPLFKGLIDIWGGWLADIERANDGADNPLC